MATLDLNPSKERLVMNRFRGSFLLVVLLVASVLLPSSLRAAKPEEVKETVRADGIDWHPTIPFATVTLTVAGGDVYFRKTFDHGPISFNLSDAPDGAVPDGTYSYELVFAPVLDEATRAALRDAHERNDEAAIRRMRREGKIPTEAQTFSNAFVVAGGTIVPRDLVEPTAADSDATPQPTTGSSESRLSLARRVVASGVGVFHPNDLVVADDQIVQGSLCVGLDCVNNESFGFDTIRMKENNTRVKFNDTSTAAGFPTNDWQLTANDSASGGANKFSIEDIDNTRVPFTITAPAPTNSIFVATTGKVGFRTATPALDLHMTTTDTPAIRFEQTNGGGFTAQTWDIGANEANFFVRDITGGSGLPFRIRPGAPTSSVDINANANVGFGIATANASLHLFRASNTAEFLIEDTGPTVTDLDMVYMKNIGRPSVVFENTDPANAYIYVISGPGPAGMNIYDRTTPGATKVAIGSTAAPSYTLDVTGDLRVTGSIIGGPTPPKAGIIAAASFAGSPLTASVTFGTPYPNTDYAIALTPVSSNGKLVFNVLSKTAAGFVVSTDKSIIGLQELDWITTVVNP